MALAITGYRAISGPHFFGLDAAAPKTPPAKERAKTKQAKDAAPTADAAPAAAQDAPA